MQELTGKWHSAGDGMIYQIAQYGNNIYLYGSGNGCTNVGFGTLDPQEKSIIFQWADTPDSKGFGSHGICYLDASQPGLIIKKAGCPQYSIGNFRKI